MAEISLEMFIIILSLIFVAFILIIRSMNSGGSGFWILKIPFLKNIFKWQPPNNSNIDVANISVKQCLKLFDELEKNLHDFQIKLLINNQNQIKKEGEALPPSDMSEFFDSLKKIESIKQILNLTSEHMKIKK